MGRKHEDNHATAEIPTSLTAVIVAGFADWDSSLDLVAGTRIPIQIW